MEQGLVARRRLLFCGSVVGLVVVGKRVADVVEKILKGKLNKFAQERALLTQVHVVDGKKPVQKVLKKATVDAFAVFSVGENIE